MHCLQPAERAGWWVLDYKSAATPEHQPALMAQLRRYRDAVQRQTPGERVYAAFLTGDGRLVRVDDAPPAPPPTSPAPAAPPQGQGQLF